MFKFIKKIFKPKPKVNSAYSKKILCMSVFAVVIYTAMDVYMQIKYNINIDSTVTQCWYGFWGVEIISLASIKIGKIIKDKVKTQTVDNTDCSGGL